MTSTIETSSGKLIHVGKIFLEGNWTYVFLRKIAENHFVWYKESNGEEKETTIFALSREKALQLAPKYWKHQFFQTVICGFRYTLPERDEHGINAFFYQMSASYSASNGIYYDEELGNNCFVQNASEEALRIWQYLKSQNRL